MLLPPMKTLKRLTLSLAIVTGLTGLPACGQKGPLIPPQASQKLLPIVTKPAL
jgi:predicted small lipoprotein YifL